MPLSCHGSRHVDRREALDSCFPAQTVPLLQACAPCVTAPSFAYFQSAVGALRVVAGRPWLTRLAPWAFCPQRARSSGARFLAGHRWRLTAVTAGLGRLWVARVGEQRQVHGASLGGTDPTGVATTAKRMGGGHKWKDHRHPAARRAAMK
jgi:hypothetical protein